MSSILLDHQAVGRSRVATQYTRSPLFLAYLAALLAVPNEQEATLQLVAQQADIDLAQGVQLDVIGEIVGVGRIIPSAVLLSFFGFEDQPGSEGFGEEGVPGLGGRLRDELESNATNSSLLDPEYRLLIRAKIIYNHSDGTPETILAGLAFLFPGVTVAVETLGTMVLGVGIGRELNLIEQAMILQLDILPRTAGVRIGHRVMFTNQSFGFEDQPGSLTFGEEATPNIGGILAEEF